MLRRYLAIPLLALPLQAQQSVSVSGFVSDSASGRPLASAQIELRGPKDAHVAQSDASGGFRLRNIEPATYHLTVRRIGFAIWAHDLVLGARDTTLNVDLVAVRTLDTTRVGASFVGVYGEVGEWHTLNPVAGATISLIGASKTVKTDSTGLFAIETPKGGTFIARVIRPGYREQRFDVVVPPNGKIELTPLLDSAAAEPATHREFLWQDLDKRLEWRALNSAFVPAEEILRHPGGSLSDILVGAPSVVKRGLTLGGTTCVFVNGEPRPNLPLDAIRPENVLAVELYGARGDPTNTLAKSWPPGARCGYAHVASTRARASMQSDAAFAVIWLKP